MKHSKVIISAALMVFGLAQVASAESIPSGKYQGFGDGAEMIMTVEGEKLRLSIAAQGCVGMAEGLHSAKDDKTWVALMTDGTEACEIGITDGGDHYLVDEGPGCSYFHGASCGFSGQVAK